MVISGVPLYLLDDTQRYLKNAIFEEKLGISGKFSEVIGVWKNNRSRLHRRWRRFGI